MLLGSGDIARIPARAAYLASRRLALRAILAVTLSTGLAMLDVGAKVSAAMQRQLDKHETVHLGPIQRISQGATPYVDARTQYGPGHQIITYEMMRRGDRPVARCSRLDPIIDFLRADCHIPRMGHPSSLDGTARCWLLPLAIRTDVHHRRRYLTSGAIGIACGGLAWFSQHPR
jgi:hypothetical protein